MREEEWVDIQSERLRPIVTQWQGFDCNVEIQTQEYLFYANEVPGYHGGYRKGVPNPMPARRGRKPQFENDLLIIGRDEESQTWWPLVVVECKLKSLKTHDSQTYSTKAAALKAVHPYLRYGLLIAALERDEGVPNRLFRHGAYFDFMMSWRADSANDDEWAGFCRVLKKEAESAQMLRRMLFDGSKNRNRYWLVHRPFEAEELKTRK